MADEKRICKVYTICAHFRVDRVFTGPDSSLPPFDLKVEASWCPPCEDRLSANLREEGFRASCLYQRDFILDFWNFRAANSLDGDDTPSLVTVADLLDCNRLAPADPRLLCQVASRALRETLGFLAWMYPEDDGQCERRQAVADALIENSIAMVGTYDMPPLMLPPPMLPFSEPE